MVSIGGQWTSRTGSEGFWITGCFRHLPLHTVVVDTFEKLVIYSIRKLNKYSSYIKGSGAIQTFLIHALIGGLMSGSQCQFHRVMNNALPPLGAFPCDCLNTKVSRCHVLIPELLWNPAAFDEH